MESLELRGRPCIGNSRRQIRAFSLSDEAHIKLKELAKLEKHNSMSSWIEDKIHQEHERAIKQST